MTQEKMFEILNNEYFIMFSFKEFVLNFKYTIVSINVFLGKKTYLDYVNKQKCTQFTTMSAFFGLCEETRDRN